MLLRITLFGQEMASAVGLVLIRMPTSTVAGSATAPFRGIWWPQELAAAIRSANVKKQGLNSFTRMEFPIHTVKVSEILPRVLVSAKQGDR